MMHIVCADLEGVFIPEIWINVSQRTGIEELSLTTRDIADYDVLMRRRLAILKENNLTIHDIANVIAGMEPLEGAVDLLNRLQSELPVIIVSDTFQQFAGPLMQKLGWPTLFCHRLTIDSNGVITAYNLRQNDAKKKTVQALKQLKYRIIATGDSYNDIAMLEEADKGILFRPPENVIQEYPNFPVTQTHDELFTAMQNYLAESSD